MSEPRRELPTITVPENELSALGVTSPPAVFRALSSASSQPINRRHSMPGADSSPALSSSVLASSASTSTPSTPGGTKKTIPIEGRQAFLFALHRVDLSTLRGINKIESSIIGTHHVTYNFNSAAFTLLLGCRLGSNYLNHMTTKNNGKIEGALPLNNLSNDLKNSDMLDKTNIIAETLEKIKFFISNDNVGTINYFVDFNAGQSSKNVTHLRTLIGILEGETFTKKDGTTVKIKFEVGGASPVAASASAASAPAPSSSEVIFRCFLEGGGGSDSNLDNDPYAIYVPMLRTEAAKEFNYNSFSALTAMSTISRSMEQISNLSLASKSKAGTVSPAISTPAFNLGQGNGSNNMQSSMSVQQLSAIPSAIQGADKSELLRWPESGWQENVDVIEEEVRTTHERPDAPPPSPEILPLRRATSARSSSYGDCSAILFPNVNGAAESGARPRSLSVEMASHSVSPPK